MSEDLPNRKHLRHDVPHWVEDGALFFITVNCAVRNREQLTLQTIAEPLLNAARFYHERGNWHIAQMMIMPDHWHAIMGFPRGKAMRDLFQDWKRYTARTLGIQWQDGFTGARVVFGHVNHKLALFDAAGRERSFAGCSQIELRHVAVKLDWVNPDFFGVRVDLVGNQPERQECGVLEWFNIYGSHDSILQLAK